MDAHDQSSVILTRSYVDNGNDKTATEEIYSYLLFTVNGSNDTIQLSNEKTTTNECNRQTVHILQILCKAVTV